VTDFPWWKTGVVYQIYPRSFLDASGDGVGDLEGVIQKLGYLGDLGIDAIWLSPIYPSPQIDFGYDISDYCDIDPLFGDLPTFRRLLDEAHRRGIRVLMDLVLNHTSTRHPWFLESRASRESAKRNWYLWHDGAGGRPPNNWYTPFSGRALTLGGSAWEWDAPTRQFYLHSFAVEQADLNWRNPQVVRAAHDVVRFWLEMGVDGFRMDVVNYFIKDDQLRSNPIALSLRPPDWQRHVYDRNRPETHALLKEIRRIAGGYGERMLVGEVFLNDPREVVRYYGDNDELHLAFNFAFLFQPWRARAFLDEALRFESLLPAGAWPTTTLSNHDQPRHFTRYGGQVARAKVAAAMLLTLRGTPFIYYGEEIGMSDLTLAREEVQDPPGKVYWPFFKGRDPCRSPMQWSDAPNAGFTTGKPWLKVHPGYRDVNVARQSADPGSLLSFYRNLLRARRESPALHRGDFAPLIARPNHVLAFLRTHADQRAAVFLNFSGKPQRVALDRALPEAEWRTVVATHEGRAEQTVLSPNEVVVAVA
jgi:alpha-glucosidase